MTRAVLAVTAAMMLAGCAASPRAPQVGAPPDPETLQQWSVRGRLAVAGDGQGGSGSFLWIQDGGTMQLDIRGPLGTGALRVVATAETLSLEDAEGRVLDAQAARQELQARLGADLPWSNLRYWMLGLAAPDLPASVTAGPGSPPRVIEQSGWRIAYDEFMTTGGMELPRRFTAGREPVRVKVVVDQWQPGSPAPTAGSGRP